MKKNVMIGMMVVLGLAVAITSADAKTGKRAWLGVSFQTVDDDIAEAFDLDVDYGVVINDIIDDSPAEDAGLREDDIIIAVNGSKITDDDDLLDFIDDAKPGDEISLTVMRRGKEKKIDLTLGKRRRSSYSWFGDHDMNIDIDLSNLDKIKEIKRIRVPRAPRSPKTLHYSFEFDDNEYGYIGVTLLNISPELADYLGADGYGSLINEVEEDSPAEKAGLKAGDVIIKVGSDKIRDAGDVAESIQEMEEGETAALVIIRDKKSKTIKVEVEANKGHSFSQLHNLHGLQDFNIFKLLHDDDDDDLIEIKLDRDDFGSFKGEMDDLREELKKLKKELKEGLKELHEDGD